MIYTIKVNNVEEYMKLIELYRKISEDIRIASDTQTPQGEKWLKELKYLKEKIKKLLDNLEITSDEN